MKNVTLLITALCMTASLGAQKQSTFMKMPVMQKSTQQEEVFTLPGRTPAKAIVRQTNEKTASLWRPSHAEWQMFDPEMGEWMIDMEIDMIYDKAGNLIIENDGYMKYTYTYNANNLTTEYLEQEIVSEGVVKNVLRKTYQYDSIIKTLIVDQKYHDWDDATKSWVQTYHHKRNVIRNKEGNVTSCTVLLADNEGKFVKIDSVCAKYDDRLIAVELANFSTESSSNLEEQMRATNLKWKNTDGQLVKPILEMITGYNRISEADLTAFGKTATMKSTYKSDDPKNIGVSVIVTPADGLTVEMMTLEPTDEYGSYKESTKLISKEDGKDIIEEDQYRFQTYDKYFNLIEEGVIDNLIAPNTMVEGLKYDHTYLADTDKPGAIAEIVTSQFNPDNGEHEAFTKVIYSGYTDVSVSNRPNLTDNVLQATVRGNELSIQSAVAGSYTVFGITGEPLLQGAVAMGQNTTDLSTLPAGIYVLSMRAGSQMRCVKFVK